MNAQNKEQNTTNNFMQSAAAGPAAMTREEKIFSSIKPEQQEIAGIMLAGFEKALEEFKDYIEAADFIAEMYNAKKGCFLHGVALGYVAGVCHGMGVTGDHGAAEGTAN